MTHQGTKTIWRRVFAAVGFCALLVSCAHVNDTSFQREIEQLQENIDQAMLANNPVALGSFLRNDVTRTGPGGVTTNRAQWLGQLEGGQIRYLSVRRCQTTIRNYQNTAVVTGLVDIEVIKPSTGRELEHNRYTRVYVREEGAWRLAAHQATQAPSGITCQGSTGATSP